ncbi:hypothetical protein NFJ02_30g77470 [Pycnococcus provasolii]
MDAFPNDVFLVICGLLDVLSLSSLASVSKTLSLRIKDVWPYLAKNKWDITLVSSKVTKNALCGDDFGDFGDNYFGDNVVFCRHFEVRIGLWNVVVDVPASLLIDEHNGEFGGGDVVEDFHHTTCLALECRGGAETLEKNNEGGEQQTVNWRKLCALFEPLQAACPCCAACNKYVGREFTNADIDTGWRAQIVIERSLDGTNSAQRPLTHKLARRAHGPRLTALRLRPLVNGTASECSDAGDDGSLVGGLFRSDDGFADRLVSVVMSGDRRYVLGNHTLHDHGVRFYDCIQLGKNCRVAFTRVGRFCDEHGDRAHVFGTLPVSCRGAVGTGISHADAADDVNDIGVVSWVASAQRAHDEPSCPLCQGAAFALPTSRLRVDYPVSPELPLDCAPCFDGELFACARGLHVWGWRRQTGAGTLLYSPAIVT